MIATALALGLAAGALHALTGPDHVAGVAPFAARRGRAAWRTGVAWGLGHAAGAAAAAAVALALRAQIPGLEEGLSEWSERLVGLLLCVIGALGLARILRQRAAHDVPATRDRSVFGLGLVHGAAGISHLFAVLPALAFPGTLAPAAYLAAYALASLGAIALLAIGIGGLASTSRPSLRNGVVAAAYASSLVVGALWLARAS
ncbi:MAG: hypothetical protein JNK02_15330 [Planctomycetes bacterium]|nr:hypothetical protein [Planctomycetota bacterium]